MLPRDFEIESQPKNYRIFIWLLIIMGSLTPIIVYTLTLGRIPTIIPLKAKQLLSSDTRYVLLDVRTTDEFLREHLKDAANWPVAEIFKTQNFADIPAEFRDRPLLLLCNSGISSAQAVSHLLKIGKKDVINIKGGMQDWIGTVLLENRGTCTPASGCCIVRTDQGHWFEPAPKFEQYLAVVSGFGFKGTYTILSLILFILLWRCRSQDLMTLRWGLIFFFIGENFCLANYQLYQETSYLFEYLHSLGMLLAFSFITFAALEGFDRRILKLSDPDRPCAALALCHQCIKHASVDCGLRRVFYIAIPGLAIIAMIPMTTGFVSVSYNTMIFDTCYNYSHRVLYQIFESRFCPIAAAVFLSVSLLILLFKKTDPMPLAKMLFAAGIGPLGFGLFRTFLAHAYTDRMVWFIFWEETTELMTILAIAAVLWIFRRGLFHDRKAPSHAE